MSIMDMFKAAPAPAPQQQQQAPQEQPQPGNMPQQQVPTEGQIPNQEPVQQQNDDPLSAYADLWETKPNQEADAPIYSALDPSKVRDVVGKASFTQGVTTDHLSAISEGGEGAIVAFKQAMDSVARQVMMQSTVASSKMVEQAIAKSQEATQANLPSMLKQHNTLTANPLFSNPAVRPVIEAVQTQLSSKYPDATADQLATMAQEFVTAMGESFAPKSADTQVPPTEDWDNFLTL